MALEERNRLLRALKSKRQGKRAKRNHMREKGFTTYVSGANAEDGRRKRSSRQQPSGDRTRSKKALGVTLFECESRQADTKHTELDGRDDNGSGTRAQWSRKPKVSIKTMDGSEISLGRREVKEDEHSREVSADPYAETVSSSGAPAVAATIGTQKCIGADAAAEVTSTRTAAVHGTHHVRDQIAQPVVMPSDSAIDTDEGSYSDESFEDEVDYDDDFEKDVSNSDGEGETERWV